MFLILNLMLIILINKTYAYITQDSEIILLPAWNPTEAKEIPLTLKLFGKLMQLSLRRNDKILSPAFEVWENNAKGVTEKLSELNASNVCCYLHEDHVSSAVINFCQEHGWEGLIFLENDLLEIRPLRNVFAPFAFIDDFCVRDQINVTFGKPHLIKKSLRYFANSDLNQLHKIKSKRHYTSSKLYVDYETIKELPKAQAVFTIELAVFVDAEAYRKILPFMGDMRNIRNMMYLIVSYIQAFFHHPSLGVRIDISLVRLDIMTTQPSNLPILDNSSAMLDSFCQYSTKINPPNDDDPKHWDISLYISGMDLFEPVAKFLGITYRYKGYLGIAYVGGACQSNFSCALVKFPSYENVGNDSIKLSIVAAHEIGHLLGFEHEFEENSEPYIMHSGTEKFGSEYFKVWSSLNRITIETQLLIRPCLRIHAKPQNLGNDNDNRSTYAFNKPLRSNDLSGRERTAKAQCEIFLGDEDANVVTLHDICRNLQCETPHKNKSYFVRRPLNGTYCALGKECRGGECVPVIEPYISKNSEEDNWSEWQEDFCKSSCLKKSKGVQVKRRFCEHRGQRTANCTGPYYDVVLCDDSSLCTEERTTISQFIGIKCAEFSNLAKFANLTVELLKAGFQKHHDVEKPWISCTVFCARKKEYYDWWYAPRQEMLDFGVDPYFPDGTWCHNEDGQDYYCRQHYCLPQSYSFDE